MAKGTYDGPCNRTACQKPGARFFNRSTQKYYCEECADLINESNRADTLRLYGSEELCVCVLPTDNLQDAENLLSTFI